MEDRSIHDQGVIFPILSANVDSIAFHLLHDVCINYFSEKRSWEQRIVDRLDQTLISQIDNLADIFFPVILP